MSRGATWCARAMLTLSALLAGGCVTTAGAAREEVAAAGDASVPLPPERPERAEEEESILPSGAFDAWKGRFRERALAAGITGEVFATAFAGVAVNARVLELDRNQPEFVRPIWEYLDSAVSGSRISDGRARAAERGRTLRDTGQRYGAGLGRGAGVWVRTGWGRSRGCLAGLLCWTRGR